MLYTPEHLHRVSNLSFAKFQEKSCFLVREFNLWTFSTEKSRKFWKKNSPKIQGGPQHDQFWNLSSAVDSALRDTKIFPLSPLGAEKLGVKFWNLTPHFSEKGAHPPPILYCWKALTDLYKVSEFGVSSPRNKKMPAMPELCPLGLLCEFIEKRQL